MKKTFLLFALALIANFTSSAQFNAAEYLDINNVKARYMVHGDMFWDPATGAAAYEFPKGSGKHSGFASSIWIGGYDQSTNNLHLAAQTYRNGGNDYWPGPLDLNNGSASDTITAAKWAQIWKVNRSTIDSFLAITNHTIANIPKSILEWPGRQNPHCKTPTNAPLTVPNRRMAPFVDVNNDNIFNALDGDYPSIKGDQMLWWVFNDNSAPHTQSSGIPIKVEIHASAYACNQTGIENTTFLNYKLFNFNTSILDSAVVTFWNDIDLGYAFDDYIGFDSVRRMGITYNGDNFDETAIGYDSSLTQKAAVIIRQPGDLANYRSPVGAFTYHNNGFGNDGDPNIDYEHYNYMTGSWKNGNSFTKGCSPLDTTQAPTKYAFPDDPSIVGGISEMQCNNAPNDRRFLLSSAPFTFVPGVVPLEFTFAFINTDRGVDNSNFNELRRLADSAYKYADGCQSTLWPNSVPNIRQSAFKVYPNPSQGFFVIEDEGNNLKQIRLFNTQGQVVLKKETQELKTRILTNQLPKGLYFLRIEKDKESNQQSILVR